MTVYRFFFALLAALSLQCAHVVPIVAQPSDMDPELAGAETAKEETRAERFMISAANPLAAKAGYDILKAGGSAVDAAIAAQMVLNLVEPQSSGIGGGAFLVHYDAKSDRVTTYDGRETAPEAATPRLFLDADGKFVGFRNALVGGRSTGVPGLVRMLERAHDDHGRLKWRDLFTPAIRLSEDGFAVSPRLAAMLEASARSLLAVPESAAYFYHPDGSALAQGETLKNPAFAEALHLIAEDADTFYEGAIADAIVERVARAVAESPHPDYPAMSAKDLKGYEAVEREPVCGPYRVYTVCGMGPPSSGGVTVLQILAMIEPFDLAAMGPEDPQAIHLIAEASRRAFADRALYLADADQVPVPLDGLLDRAYLAGRSAGIDLLKVADAAMAPGVPPGGENFPYATSPTRGGRSTTHLSVVDADGNAVALTSSIETAFGSRLMVYGFLLNNQLTDFSFAPDNDGVPVANAPGSGKRPRSSMSPTLVFNDDGSLRMVIGSPGGNQIIGFVVKTIVAHLDWGLGIQAAIDFPHLINENGGTSLEDKPPLDGMKDALEAMGHEVRLGRMASGLHGIAVLSDGLHGGADPRREGVAMGD